MQFNILLCLLSMKSKIKNLDLPSCNNCIYFTPYIDPAYNNLSLCKKFGDKNLIDGKIRYMYAQYAREDETRCGKKGIWFTPNLKNNDKWLD